MGKSEMLFLKRKFLFFIVIFFIINFINTGKAQQLQATLTFAASFNSAPYKWIENNQFIGIDVDIVREACKRANIKPVFKNYPWKRVLKEVERGMVDGGFTAFKTPEREKYAYFLMGAPIHYSTYSVFAKKRVKLKYKKLQDLYGLKIGISRGFKVSKEFDYAVKTKKIIVQEADTVNNLIKMVLSGRVDAFVHNKDYTLHKLKNKKFINSIKMYPIPVQPARAAYLIISIIRSIDNKTEIVKKLNNALKAMKKDGTIERIHKVYLN